MKLLTIACSFLFITDNLFAQELQVGFGVVEITPPVGYRMAGNYQEKFSTGVNDPLYAKAMVVAVGSTKMAILVCDVCNVSRDLTDPIRRQANIKTGISEMLISVTATHTHAGPLHADPVLRILFRERAGAKSDDDDPKEMGYRKKFIESGIAAIALANQKLRPAKWEYGQGTLKDVAFNRRFHMKDGSVRFNPGKMNANIVKVAGPVNEAVPFLMAIDAKTDKPFGCFTSFDMHVAVFGGTKYGACYPGALQKALRETYGEEFVSVFGEGCAGDINHVNVRQKEKDFDSVEIGNKLAETIVKTKREVVTHSSIVGMPIKVDCPLKADRSAELPAMRERLIGKDFAKVPFLEQVEACQVHITEYLRKRDGCRASPEIQTFRLGEEVAIVCLPHEVFVELGLEIKKQSPFKHTFVITLANDVDCYVPTRKAFAEGSYEVTNSPYAPGVGELLVDAAVKSLKGMK